VWITFVPQAGHEQAGRCPAVVLSPRRYNTKAGLSLCCPVTTRAKGYPFEVPLPEGLGVEGVVLADAVKSLDWRARNIERAGRVPEATLAEIVGKLTVLLSG
jgi:mRNA interferase MazF